MRDSESPVCIFCLLFFFFPQVFFFFLIAQSLSILQPLVLSGALAREHLLTDSVLERMTTTNAEVCLTPGPSHVRSTLEAAALQDFSHNFSDVTLVFRDGSMVYYRALLYLLSPWWKELLIQVQIIILIFCFFPFNLTSQYCSHCP